MRRRLRATGFTLVEIIVVVAVISALAAVFIGGLGSRDNARDERRMSDLQQIKVALRLYAEANGEYPCEDDAQCAATVQTGSANGQFGIGGHIDELLEPYLPNVPQDPMQDGSDFYYYYDPRQNCGGVGPQAVIFARTMETEKYRNASSTVCSSWGGEGGAGEPETHMIVLGQSPDTY